MKKLFVLLTCILLWFTSFDISNLSFDFSPKEVDAAGNVARWVPYNSNNDAGTGHIAYNVSSTLATTSTRYRSIGFVVYFTSTLTGKTYATRLYLSDSNSPTTKFGFYTHSKVNTSTHQNIEYRIKLDMLRDTFKNDFPSATKAFDELTDTTKDSKIYFESIMTVRRGDTNEVNMGSGRTLPISNTARWFSTVDGNNSHYAGMLKGQSFTNLFNTYYDKANYSFKGGSYRGGIKYAEPWANPSDLDEYFSIEVIIPGSSKPKPKEVTVEQWYEDTAGNRFKKISTEKIDITGGEVKKTYTYKELSGWEFADKQYLDTGSGESAVLKGKTRNLTITGNTQTILLIWIVKGGTTPPPSTNCGAPNLPPPRYEYKMNFSVDRIEAPTEAVGYSVTSPVTVSREDFSAEREAAKQAIRADITGKQNEIQGYQNQISSLQAAIAAAHAAAAAAKPPTTADTSGMEAQISTLECKIGVAEQEKAHYEQELQDLIDKENMYRVTNPDTNYLYNGAFIGSQNTSLTEGQSAILYTTLVIDNDGTVSAEINYNLTYEETTYGDNYRETPIYKATFAVSPCSAPNGTSTISGIVRTVSDKFQGNLVYWEHLTGTIQNLTDPDKIKAGYGFGYEVKVTYSTEWAHAYTAPTELTTYKPSMSTYQTYAFNNQKGGFQVPMELTQGVISNAIWELPIIYAEEFSGHLFEDTFTTHPNRNPNDPLINGGRKWYIPFDEPDGIYAYPIYSGYAGVNRLSLCLNGQVIVFGSALGDPDSNLANREFLLREVNPNTPFPGGIGVNWKGNETMLTSLSTWRWNNPYSNPDDVPRTANLHEFVLRRDNVQDIQAFNKNNGLFFERNYDFFNIYSVEK